MISERAARHHRLLADSDHPFWGGRQPTRGQPHRPLCNRQHVRGRVHSEWRQRRCFSAPAHL